jgi:hypothetical protein
MCKLLLDESKRRRIDRGKWETRFRISKHTWEIRRKYTSFVNPEPLRTPQAKALKHSPYFPRVLADPESPKFQGRNLYTGGQGRGFLELIT